MNRKVIFLPDDYWTHPPEENTVPEDATPTSAGDYRRAAVVTLHHRRGNVGGLIAIVEETNAAGRAAHLVLATLHLHEGFISTLRTDDGIGMLADYIHGMATLDATEPPGTDIRRAAQVLEHYGKKNMSGIHHEMTQAVAEGRVTECFRQLLDLYEVAMPELSSAAGTRWIEDHITALANEEVRGDGA